MSKSVPTRIRVRDSRKGNWWWAENAIVDRYAKEIGATAFMVYCFLVRQSNQEGRSWWSQTSIGEALGISRSTVHRAIKTLSEAGLIAVEENVAPDNQQQTSNTYWILQVPDPHESAPFTDEHPRVTSDTPLSQEMNTPMSPVTPPYVMGDTPGGSTSDTPPMSPVTHKQDISNKTQEQDLKEQKPEEQRASSSRSSNPQDSPSVPYRIYAYWQTATPAGAPTLPPSAANRQMAIAKQMLKDGYSEDQIKGCIDYMSRDRYWTLTRVGWTLQDVRKQIDAWIAGGEQTTPPAPPSASRRGDHSGLQEFVETWKDAENRLK